MQIFASLRETDSSRSGECFAPFLRASAYPTKAVRQGEPTYDEMMMGFMDYTAEKPQTLAKVDPHVFDTYVGKYEFPDKRPYVVTREGDRYFGQAPNNPKRELFAASPTNFFIPEVESQVTFVKDEKGEVVELVYEQNENIRRCKRVREATASNRYTYQKD